MISEESGRPDGFPEHLWDGFKRYVLHGVKPGSFLRAFFEGDFHEMCRRGGRELVADLWEATVYLHGSCPPECYGSAEAMKLWMSHGGMRGLEKPRMFVEFELQEDCIEFRTGAGGEISDGVYRQADVFFAHAPVRRTSMEGDNDARWVRFFFEPALELEEAERLEELFGIS